MKFCKSLQKVAEMSDPDWAPYWTNYKLLKKLIKGLPSLVHPDAQSASHEDDTPSGEKSCENQLHSSSSDELDEKKRDCSSTQTNIGPVKTIEARKAMGQSPGEVKFFKQLHAEMKKAIYFFGKAEEEFIIREERVRDGMEILKNTDQTMVAATNTDKWVMIARSFYRLYKDLLLLETFAIMTYCSFSKILKKHDKVTGYNTRCAFMNNVVNRANFANYPRTLEMVQRTQVLYEEATEILTSEGKSDLYEDERLFINMIHQVNEQAIGSEKKEDAADIGLRKEEEISRADPTSSLRAPIDRYQQQAAVEECADVKENAKKRSAFADCSSGNVSDESTDSLLKKARKSDD